MRWSYDDLMRLPYAVYQVLVSDLNKKDDD